MPSPAPSHAPVSGATATVTLILTLLGWSSIPLFLRHFTHSIDGWTANGWRYGISALIWAPVLLLGYRNFFRGDPSALPKNLWRAAIVPSLFNAAGQAAFGLAPYYVEPGLMTFALRLQIVFVTLGAAILFVSERRVIRRPWFLIGLIACFGGTIGTLLFKPGGLGTGTTFGVLLAAGSGLLYACYALSVRHYMHGVRPLTAFAAISQYTAVLLILPMFFFGDRAGAGALDLSGGQFSLLVLSSLIGIGLGHTLYYISIARLGVAVSAGVLQLQPVVVSAASYFLFREILTLPQWVCGGIAILGAAVILRVQHIATQARVARLHEPEPAEFATLPVDPIVAEAATAAEEAGESSRA